MAEDRGLWGGRCLGKDMSRFSKEKTCIAWLGVPEKERQPKKLKATFRDEIGPTDQRFAQVSWAEVMLI